MHKEMTREEMEQKMKDFMDSMVNYDPKFNDIVNKYYFDLIDTSLPPADGAEEILPQFGDYCTIEMKRYGCANEHYTHKVVGTLRSNSWVDVPVQSPATETNHVVKELEPVVACVCEGIAEREILRYRISDTRNLKKPATLHAQRLADKMVNERLRDELIKFLADEQVKFTYGVIGDYEIVNKYLKSRER